MSPTAKAGRWRSLRALLVLCAGLLLLMSGGCAGPRLDVSPAALLATGKLDEQVAEQLRRVDNSALTATQRRNAGQALLGMKGSDAVRARVSTLSNPGDPDTWRAMLQAVIRYDRNLPDDLVRPMLALLGEVNNEEIESDLAQALGLYDDKETSKKLAGIARDGNAPILRRQQAMLALGYHRTKADAKVLIELTDPKYPQPVRESAFNSLIVMTGRQDYYHDHAAWQAWWDQARRLNDERWYERLTETIERQRTIVRDEQTELARALRETKKGIYYSVSDQDKPRVLVDMLSDDLMVMRDVALELCLERLQEGQRFDEFLRAAIRTRMSDDKTPEIRERAALLLRDLADERAADAAAMRLAEQREHVASVRRAYLLLLARMPRADAVRPAVEMLDDSALTAEAAGALAAAADQRMLDRRSADLAARKLRSVVRDQPQPAPQIVQLLGRVGDDNDWKNIVQWIDSENPQIKAAAAQAWADSDKPLSVLADRVNDPVIQPIVYKAAAQRGADPQTMKRLAARRPDRQANRDAWRRAMVAMAARVPAEDVLETVDILQNQEEPDAQIESVLTSALERTNSPALTDKQRVELALQRAEIRMAKNEYAKALEDFRVVGGYQQQLTEREFDRLLRGQIESQLQMKEVDAAFSTANQLVSVQNGGDVHLPSDHPAIDLFLRAARRMHDEGENAEALDLLRRLRLLMGPGMKDQVAQQIHQLELQIRGGGSAEVRRQFEPES